MKFLKVQVLNGEMQVYVRYGPDQLKGMKDASTPNRNFEGRQGYKGRTHLVSPIMAAAASLEASSWMWRD